MRKQFCSLALIAATVLMAVACSNNATTEKTTTDTTVTSTTTTAKFSDDWKLGVQLWTFRMFTMAEALQKVDSAGIKYVEAFMGQQVDADTSQKFGPHMSQPARDKLKELLKSHNIQMVAMGVIVPKTKQDWQDAFKLAKEFNLSYITCEPLKDQWDYIDSLAGVYNIKLAIHDHPKPNPYAAPDSVLAAIANHHNIGSCADLGHWARNGYNPVDCLKKLEGHIYGVHLKDIKQFDNPKAADTVVGKGVIQFGPIFAELKRQNFKGMLSIEHESNWYHGLPDVIETVQFYNKQVDSLK